MPLPQRPLSFVNDNDGNDNKRKRDKPFDSSKSSRYKSDDNDENVIHLEMDDDDDESVTAGDSYVDNLCDQIKKEDNAVEIAEKTAYQSAAFER
jgi:hypothetical protein